MNPIVVPDLDCPALHFISDGYPPNFRGRVPRKIRMAKTVRPDWQMAHQSGVVLEMDREYYAWTNSNGAVCGICDNGKRLGVKPFEYDVIEWHNTMLSVDGEKGVK